jgi:hypothetical protein
MQSIRGFMFLLCESLGLSSLVYHTKGKKTQMLPTFYTFVLFYYDYNMAYVGSLVAFGAIEH